MFSHDFVRRRVGYSHPLWSALPNFDLDNDTVKKLVVEQDWSQLILVHGRMGLHIAGYYIQRGGSIDDVVGGAMLGVCMAVARIRRKEFENVNPSAFIASAIHRECYNVILADQTIWAGRRKRIPICPLIESLDGVTEFDIVQFDEIMELIVESDLEQEVISLRRNGFDDMEIAELLTVSRFTISRIRNALYERYLSYVK